MRRAAGQEAGRLDNAAPRNARAPGTPGAPAAATERPHA